MNRSLIILIAVLALGALGIFVLGGEYISVHNTCVAKEASLEASKDQSKSVYDNFWKKVKEVASVPSNYSKDMAETYAKIMNARYGNSTQVAMNWIKEANPNFDSSMYKQVQEVVESGRNDFQASQKDMIDRVRDYKTYVGQLPTSFFASMGGFPKINWKDYEVLSSERTDNAFQTHQDDAVDPFAKSGMK